MRLAPPPLEIGDRDGFEGTDIFGYEEFGRNLASLVENLEGPSVIALDGGWGSGKTVFAKQWAGLLRTRGIAVIYFDAFAADAGDDPLFDIAGQLFLAAPDGEPRKEMAKAAVVLVKRFFPVLAGLGLRVGTGGLIGEEEIRVGAAGLADVKKTAKDGGEKISEAFRQRIEGAQNRADALSDFRLKLRSLAETIKAKALTDAEEAPEPPKLRPVVMIVDELDRCRPSYALDVLENLKHVFDVDNLCFVLVTNLDQIGQVVSNVYGLKQPRKYLEKFVQAQFRLGQDKATRRGLAPETYCNFLWKRMKPESHGMPDSASSIIRSVARHHDVSLRGIERIVMNIGMYATGPGIPQDAQGTLVGIVCAVRALAPELYLRLRRDAASSDDVLGFLGVAEWGNRNSDRDYVQNLCTTVFPPQEAVEGGNREAENAWKERAWKNRRSGVSVARVCAWLDSFGRNPQ